MAAISSAQTIAGRLMHSKVPALYGELSPVPVRTLTEIGLEKKQNFPQVQSKGFSHAFTKAQQQEVN